MQFFYLHILLKQNKNQIFIGGDSAGGNLALSLVSHISHPHASAPKVDLRGQKLAGMYLISPWVTFDINSRSMQANLQRDYLNPPGFVVPVSSFLGNSAMDEYNVPLNAAPEWWQDLPVKDTCILAGDYEVFRDDVVSIVEKIRVRLQPFSPSLPLSKKNSSILIFQYVTFPIILIRFAS